MRDFRGQEVSVGDFLLTHDGNIWQSVQADASIWDRGRALAVVAYKVKGSTDRKFMAHNLLIKLPLRISLKDTLAMTQPERSKLWEELAEPAKQRRRAELSARRGFSK